MALEQELSALDGTGRIHTLMRLVKLCTYPQQLEFVEELQKFLHKDFLTELPPDLSQKIILYVSIDDAINCLRVSKSWNKVINNCKPYWEKCTRNIGLKDSFIHEKLPDYQDSLKDLCISALNHQNRVKTLITRSFTVARSLAHTGCSYMYAGNGVALRYEELNAHAQVTIEQMNTPHSVVPRASFDVTPFSSRIKWVSASDNFVLWKQIDGKWNGYTINVPTAVLHQWDDEPVSQGFHSITFCNRCHLVAIMSEAEDDCEVWDLQIVKLFKGKSTSRKMVYPIPLEAVQNAGEKKRHFLGGTVTLLPESNQEDSTGFCKLHRVLLQVDSCLAVHTLESVADDKQLLVVHQLLPDAKLSKPLKVLCPPTSTQPIDGIEVSGSKGPPVFCISKDLQRICLVDECYLYVWNLDSYQEESCFDLIDYNLPSDIKCLALGSLYVILASSSWGLCVVVSIQSGNVILQNSLPETFHPHAYRSNRFSFYPPLQQEWLSSFQRFDYWPLALVLDYFANEDMQVELQALLAVRNQSRQRPLALNGVL